MIAPELAQSAQQPPGGAAPAAGERAIHSRITWPVGVVVVLAALGTAVRLIVAHQSLFGDELSTYWIVATHGLGSVLSLLYGTASIHHAEITPPLSFVVSWLTAQLGHSVELLRLPSLIAGVLTIPAVYLLGLRTVGRRTALVATALTAFSPFMIYYSTEARAYGVLMLLVVSSTLSMLLALDTRRTRWWVAYAVCSCAAVYTHYTCAFVLAVQLAWLVWVHPEARRPAILANVAALAGLIPWIPGLINDLTSPTVKILSALSPFTPHAIPIILGHWAIGYPYANYDAGLNRLPGTFALVLLALATVVALGGIAARASGEPASRWLPRADSRLALVAALALATPVGEAVVSTFSTHIFGVRNLAASWPALALSFAALLMASGRRVRITAVTLALCAFAIGGVLMLSTPFARPNYEAAANQVDRGVGSGEVVIDETGELSPGPLTPLDVALSKPVRIFRAGSPAERDHPFGFSDPIVPLSVASREAAAAADGRPIVVVSTLSPPSAQIATRTEPANPSLPSPYRLVQEHVYRGLADTEVRVYAERP